MSQIATFFVPISGGEAMQDEMNAFLRGHRVLQVEKAFAGNGWAFCVEWLEGAAVGCAWGAVSEYVRRRCVSWAARGYGLIQQRGGPNRWRTFVQPTKVTFSYVNGTVMLIR